LVFALALGMAKGGNTVALIAERAYELGRAMPVSAGYGSRAIASRFTATRPRA
jgi:hypothetical protein